MVLGWRKAFCTSIPKEKDSPIIKHNPDPNPTPSPKLSSRLSTFFSNPSTPRLHPQTQPISSSGLRCRTTVAPPPAKTCNSAPQSPKLQCKTKNSPGFFHRSTPSSPRSPSTFALLKSSLRLTKSRCGICLKSVKTGQGTAIFTAECGHSFHYPCITAHVRKQGTLTCPICNSTWKEMHLLSKIDHHQVPKSNKFHNPSTPDKRALLKVYNDDEPLSSPTSGSRFNPIPESDETGDESEFPGFFASTKVENRVESMIGNVEVTLLSEPAVVSVGKTTETYALVLRLKAPSANIHRAPIDLITVLNVSRSITVEKLHYMKKAMRFVVSTLSATDRLSIIAYSSTSKRLLNLRRMNTAGKRAARRIIDAVIAVDTTGPSSAIDSLKKAAKVLEDRREVNPATGILLFSDGYRSGSLVSTTRFSIAEITVHSVNLSACVNAPPEDTIAKSIAPLLSVVIHDLKIQMGFPSGEISAVYTYAGRPAYLGSGSSWSRVGEFYSEEEKELLIELKVPSSLSGSQRIITVRCNYKDPSTQQPIMNHDRPIIVPRPRAVGSSTQEIQRLRCLFVTTRAVAESRRMSERGDIAGAQHMLSSARALILQSGTGLGSGDEFVRGLEAELAELNYRRCDRLPQVQVRREMDEEKVEPLTPTSAWRTAERLAKVAIMRKTLNRVSDMHGFENARF